MSGPPLGRDVAAVLRAGTVAAMAAVAVGYGLALSSGDEGPGATPIVELVIRGGGDGLIALGLLALTLTPAAAIAAAAAAHARMGERARAVTAAAVVVLLAASLVAATAVGGAS